MIPYTYVLKDSIEMVQYRELYLVGNDVHRLVWIMSTILCPLVHVHRSWSTRVLESKMSSRRLVRYSWGSGLSRP